MAKKSGLCGELCGERKVNIQKSKKNTSKKSISGVFLQADGENRTHNLLITSEMLCH